MPSSPLVSGMPSSLPPSLAARAAGNPAESDLVVETTRSRQTSPPASPFRDVLTGGVGFLVRGAEVATSVIGGPVVAAAVRGAGAGATFALAGPPLARPAVPGAPGTAMNGTTSGLATGGGSAVAAALTSSGPGSDQSDLATMQAMQRESQVFNTQLLELQEDVQQENRRFTTVSNVLRAKHDTAKAAVSNIRA